MTTATRHPGLYDVTDDELLAWLDQGEPAFAVAAEVTNAAQRKVAGRMRELLAATNAGQLTTTTPKPTPPLPLEEQMASRDHAPSADAACVADATTLITKQENA